MKRLLCFSLIVGLCCLPGCGGGGGEAEFDPSGVEEPTAEEQKETDDYNKLMEEQGDNVSDSSSN